MLSVKNKHYKNKFKISRSMMKLICLTTPIGQQLYNKHHNLHAQQLTKSSTYKLINLQDHKLTNSSTKKLKSSNKHQLTNSSTQKLTNLPTHQPTNSKTRTNINLQTHQHTSPQTNKLINLQTQKLRKHQLTNLQTHKLKFLFFILQNPSNFRFVLAKMLVKKGVKLHHF